MHSAGVCTLVSFYRSALAESEMFCLFLSKIVHYHELFKPSVVRFIFQLVFVIV